MDTAIANLPLANASDILRDVAALLLPDKRMLPSDAAARYLRNDRGAWDPDLAPELVEPLDLVGGRRYTGIAFVGPSRSSKTFSLVLGAITYIVTIAPGDCAVIGMSQDSVKKFSRKELDRVIRHSPEIADRLSPRPRDDSAFAKYFRNGMALTMGWPALSQLASETLRYAIITDYDRPGNRDDVEGEGPLWDLAGKRVETYMSRGKCIAESSPGEEIEDAAWKPSSTHEAPPAKGILSLYNRGTMARFYWPCKHCGEHFQARPGPEAFRLPEFEELEQLVKQHAPAELATRYAHVYCPHCGGQHDMEHRPAMKRAGLWLHEGDKLVNGRRDESGRRRSSIASFWMGGVAATYQRWDRMLESYLSAVAVFAATGDETSLKARTSMDFAAPYLPRARMRRATPEHFQQRLEEWERGIVPAGVRFLTAAVDVQGKRFCVSIMGWGVGLESWLVERFSIEMSQREDVGRALSVDPAAFVEDWMLLDPQVVQHAYPVAGVEGLTLLPKLVLVDSGGREGVTERAYTWWRGLRRSGLSARVRLVKGDARLNAPRTQETFPDNRSRSDRMASGRGDVPVVLINVNALKDGIDADLKRDTPGPGYCHFPKWADDGEFFDELTAERRGARGWERVDNRRNEAWDLHVYNRAGCILLRAENIDWTNPPEWARPLEGRKPGATGERRRQSIGDLARELNGGVSFGHGPQF